MKMVNGHLNAKNAAKAQAQWSGWRGQLWRDVNVRPARQREVNLHHATKCPHCGKPQRVVQTFATTICEGQVCTCCKSQFIVTYILGFCEDCSRRIDCLSQPVVIFPYDASVE